MAGIPAQLILAHSTSHLLSVTGVIDAITSLPITTAVVSSALFAAGGGVVPGSGVVLAHSSGGDYSGVLNLAALGLQVGKWYQLIIIITVGSVVRTVQIPVVVT